MRLGGGKFPARKAAAAGIKELIEPSPQCRGIHGINFAAVPHRDRESGWQHLFLCCLWSWRAAAAGASISLGQDRCIPINKNEGAVRRPSDTVRT